MGGVRGVYGGDGYDVCVRVGVSRGYYSPKSGMINHGMAILNSCW